jgi:hypothetical protein
MSMIYVSEYLHVMWVPGGGGLKRLGEKHN